MMRNRLRYVGKGQIVRESDGRLVSPRDVVRWYNEVCDVADQLHASLKQAPDVLPFAKQRGALA